jgi:hypothetical protein
MKELTSSYDDLEKRLAVFAGLAALVFCSLYLFTQGADLWTYLVRGVLALALFSAGGWAYGHWLRSTMEGFEKEEELPSNVERRTREPQAVEGQVVGLQDMPETVIPAEAPQVKEFAMPDFGGKAEPGDEDLPPPPPPAGL